MNSTFNGPVSNDSGENPRHQQRTCTRDFVRRRMLAMSVAFTACPRASVDIAIWIVGWELIVVTN